MVQYDKLAGGYRLAFAYKAGVPPFGPVLSPNTTIRKEELKEILLTKCTFFRFLEAFMLATYR